MELLFLKKLQTTIEWEPDAVKVRCIYKLAEGVPDTTYNLIMATQEHGGAVVETESTKDESAQKPGHNNPKEAGQFISDVTDLTNTFMQDIQGFDKYSAQNAYKMYISNLKRRLVVLDNTFFQTANTETVFDTILDKMCKLYVKHKPEGE